MNKVYLVIGERGNYADVYSNWIVAVYPTSGEAKIHADLANKAMDKIGGYSTTRNPYDPICTIGDLFEKPTYRVEEVEFGINVEELLERGFFNVPNKKST